MAHNYNGDATGVTPATAIQVAIPDDGDADNVASVNPTAFQRLTNWVKFLFSFTAFMGGASGGSSYNNVGPAGGTAFRATGGTGNSAGILGTGSGTGPGIWGESAAASSGNAVQGNASGTGAGVAGTNAGAGPAASFDATGGTGDAVDAFAGNSYAVNAGNTSAAPTINAVNSGAGPAAALQSTVAGHLGDALKVVDGMIDFSGGGSPAATQALKNKVTPALVVKAWAYVTVAGGVATLQDGQNVASVSINAGGGFGHTVQINWAQAFASGAYGVGHFNAPKASNIPINLLTSNQGQAAGNVKIGFWDTGANAPVDPSTTDVGVVVYALGVQ